jgi:hypothetical protein
MVPVIVNAILNEHQLIIDIVSFVQKGDFHRSRLGEKQRGKILAGWVTRKMRTIAQYSIRDPNAGEMGMGMGISEEGGQGRQSMSGSMMGMGRMSMSGMGGPASIKASSTRAPSLLGMTTTMNSLSLAQQQQHGQQQPPSTSPLPSGQYPQSIPEIPPPSQPQGVELHDPSDRTPTEHRHSFLPDLGQDEGGPMDYPPIERAGPFGGANDAHQPGNYQNAYHPQQQQYQASIPDILRPGPGDEAANGSMSDGTWNGRDFYSDSTPYHSYGNSSPDPQYHQQGGLLGIANPEHDDPHEPSWTMVSQQSQNNYQGQGGYQGEEVTRYISNGSYDSGRGGYGGGGGGLRVANRDSTDSAATEDSWRRDVLAQMNFAGGPGGQQGGHHAA